MQPNPASEQVPYRTQVVRDLCQTCVHVEGCALRQMPTSPVHDCDEFDDGGRPAAAPALRVQKHQVDRRAPASTGVGLCVNCEHEPTCTLPRPTAGVWHCEEYR